MHEAVKTMLSGYDLSSTTDYQNALHEIFQSIALLGLWRSKFFEHAAFYGGTALRILHGLNRFSEDLDFSLLSANLNFDILPYLNAVQAELYSFGFEVNVSKRLKVRPSQIESGFLKANTRAQLIEIELEKHFFQSLPKDQVLKIKLEVDVDPPCGFNTEVKPMLLPIMHSVRVYDLPSLFAGKVHAVLCRPWVNAVKGRDFYDFLWYVSRQVTLNLDHLKSRLVQSGHMNLEESLDMVAVKNMLEDRFNTVSIQKAKQDVVRFLRDEQEVRDWDKGYFLQAVAMMKNTP